MICYGCRTNVVYRHFVVETNGSSTNRLTSVNASGTESGVFHICRAYPSGRARVNGEERVASESLIDHARDDGLGGEGCHDGMT